MDRPQASNFQTELVFHSPSLREEFNAGGIAMLVIIPLVALILGGAAAFVSGNPWAIFIYVVIILMGAVCGAAVLVFRRGKVVVGEDGLVEYNGLNASRRFGYDQIFDFKSGAYANSLVIHYYPRLKNGTIDTLHPQSTRLISVQNDVGLKMAIARRITASRIVSTAGKDHLPGLILLVFLLVFLPMLLFWGLNLH